MSAGKTTVAAMLVVGISLSPIAVHAHCQIPCGIYDDDIRLDLMAEDIATIEKAMKEISDLSSADKINYNQLVRWIDNKDTHADKFMNIATQYFMVQRIKPVAPDSAGFDIYLKQVRLLHQMLYIAMRCKQTTDLNYPAQLKQLLGEFRNLYNEHHTH